MRTTSLKTIYLTIPELQEAVAEYIRDKQIDLGPEDLYTHLMNNEVCMDWASEGEEFAISMDGEVEDNKGPLTNESDEAQVAKSVCTCR